MKSTCQKCSRKRSGREYLFYYNREIIRDDKSSINGSSKSFQKDLESSKAFICDSCVLRGFTRLVIILSAISILITLFGIFGHMTIFGHILVGMVGLFGFSFIIALFRVEKDWEEAGGRVAIDLNRKDIREKYGANSFFTPGDYKSKTTLQLSKSREGKPDTEDSLSFNPPETLKEKTQLVESFIICPRCGRKNPPSTMTCENCMWLLGGVKEQGTPSTGSYLAVKDYKESETKPPIYPSQINSFVTAANLAVINALLTIGVAILQFISGGSEAIVAGVINTVTAISYFVTSISIRKGDLGSLKAGLSMAKWGFLWVLGMAVYFNNTSGGIDAFAAFIFVGWLLTDGALYLTLKNIEKSIQN